MALEDVWRERAQFALEGYLAARDECRSAIERQSDAAPPDGAPAYRQALRNESAALAEYRRMLRIFNELTIDGKMPPAE